MTGLIVALVVVAVLFAATWTRRRYGEKSRPEPGWVRTDEVFVDPGTSRRMRVWTDPRDGSRHYVPDGAKNV